MVNSIRFGHYRDRRFDSRDRQMFAVRYLKIFKTSLIFERKCIPNNLENIAERSCYLVVFYCLLLFLNVIDHLTAKDNIWTISHSRFAAILSPFLAIKDILLLNSFQTKSSFTVESRFLYGGHREASSIVSHISAISFVILTINLNLLRIAIKEFSAVVNDSVGDHHFLEHTFV